MSNNERITRKIKAKQELFRILYGENDGLAVFTKSETEVLEATTKLIFDLRLEIVRLKADLLPFVPLSTTQKQEDNFIKMSRGAFEQYRNLIKSYKTQPIYEVLLAKGKVWFLESELEPIPGEGKERLH
jgi:hypothetical protein